VNCFWIKHNKTKIMLSDLLFFSKSNILCNLFLPILTPCQHNQTKSNPNTFPKNLNWFFDLEIFIIMLSAYYMALNKKNVFIIWV
jgi:hypothetical protein